MSFEAIQQEVESSLPSTFDVSKIVDAFDKMFAVIGGLQEKLDSIQRDNINTKAEFQIQQQSVELNVKGFDSQINALQSHVALLEKKIQSMEHSVDNISTHRSKGSKYSMHFLNDPEVSMK